MNTPRTIKTRSPWLALLFTFLTLGIYGFYWHVKLTNDSNTLSKIKTAGGGKALLFGFITFGIYQYYWYYMLGKKVGDMENASSDGGLYLFLYLFLLGFVAKILAQKAINRTVAKARERANAAAAQKQKA